MARPRDTRELRYKPRVVQTIEAAASVAKELGHDYIGTEHLLIALIDDERGIAGQVLAELGVADTARTRTFEILRSKAYDTSAPPPRYVGGT
jgi:ATP-dependent Clp protease ATP-binding subunit ClpC